MACLAVQAAQLPNGNLIMTDRTNSSEWPPPLTPLEEENTHIDTKIIELRETYESKMKDYSPGKRHSRVIVLLLYWDKVANSYLNTEDEVNDLECMFKENFRYTVYKKSLNAVPGKSAKVLLQKYISDVVLEIDAPSSLLIIYYAGHGNPGENGDIIMTGGNYHPGDRKVDTIVWSKAETLVRNAEQTDVLLIFDCCYAAKIAEDATRQGFSPRNFEYFAASNELTKAPGEESFTSALLHALGELSKDSDGFTTSKLCYHVRRAPKFPKNQTPVLEERLSYTSRRLLLAPLPDMSGNMANVARIDTDEDKDHTKYGLCLQLTFERLPTPLDMEKMCQGLKDMVQHNELNATQINWRGMHRSNESMYDIPALGYFAAKKWVTMTRRGTKTSIGSKEMMNTSKSRRLSGLNTPPPEVAGMQLLQNCESPDTIEEKINTHSMEEAGEVAGETVVDFLEERKLVVPRSAYDYRPDLTHRKFGYFSAGLLIGAGFSFCAIMYGRKV